MCYNPYDDSILIVDNFSRIRKLKDGIVSTVAGDGTTGGYSDGPALQAKFGCITGIAVDNEGNIVVGDSSNHVIRMVSASNGKVSTIAGRVKSRGHVDGDAASTRFYLVCGILIDGMNNIYVSDISNDGGVKSTLIRKLVLVGGDYYSSTVVTRGSGLSWCQDLSFDMNGDIISNEWWPCPDDKQGVIHLIHAKCTLPPYLQKLYTKAEDPLLEHMYLSRSNLFENAVRYKSDIVFLVEGQEIHAHKSVLMEACEYFRPLFGPSFHEGHLDTITVSHATYESFRCVIRYIYTGNPRGLFTSNNVIEIYHLAQYYGLSKLQEQSIAFLKSQTSLTEVVSLYLACYKNVTIDSVNYILREKLVQKWDIVSDRHRDSFSSVEDKALVDELSTEYYNFKSSLRNTNSATSPKAVA